MADLLKIDSFHITRVDFSGIWDESVRTDPALHARASKKILQDITALTAAPHEIFMLNGEKVTGLYEVQIGIRNDEKALLIALMPTTPQDAPENYVRGPSSYTSVDLKGLGRNFKAAMRDPAVLSRLVFGGDAMTKGPVRELVRLAARARPSIMRAPKNAA
jgi:hypothetical protein